MHVRTTMKPFNAFYERECCNICGRTIGLIAIPHGRFIAESVKDEQMTDYTSSKLKAYTQERISERKHKWMDDY